MDRERRIGRLGGMSKTFRAYEPKQKLLLPPDLREWLREGHLALYISDVVEELDLSGIVKSYEEGAMRGRPPYHPAMMVKLLIYGYSVGRTSSRKIEEATYDDVAFRVLSCDQHPDHDSIAEFRKRHLRELGKLFRQVLEMCQRAGLVKMRHVAIDGTKVKANASKRESLTYERMKKEVEKELEREAKRILEEAERIDEEEDKLYGKGKRGDELPEELLNPETRLAKIREMLSEIEQEAEEAAEEEARVREEEKEAKGKGEEVVRKQFKRKWTRTETGAVVPKAKVQRNLTDSDSRIMKETATGSYLQGYNAQIAVDEEAQIIVAARVVQQANDCQQLVPTLKEVERNVGRMPEKATADAGYFSVSAVTNETLREVDLYVPPNEPVPRDDDGCEMGEPGSVRKQMWCKLRQPGGQKTYKKRNTTVEPVFAEIKHIRRFRQFALRGLSQVESEWNLICLTHNLLKLFRARKALQIA